MHEWDEDWKINHKIKRHSEWRKSSDIDVSSNATSIKIKERLGFFKIFLEIASDIPSDLEDIFDIPNTAIAYLDLLFFPRTKLFRDASYMLKKKVGIDE